jgi:putative methyltransferase (TIGR04325 family)
MPDLMSMTLRTMRNFPLYVAYRKHRYRSQFPKGLGLFLGVFDTFEGARAVAPSRARIGFDSPHMAAMYRERLTRVYPSDYPVIYWLRRLVKERDCREVLDFGGHVGIAFYAYQRYLEPPQDVSWTIVDVPSVAREGEKLAREKGEGRLRFVTDVRDVAPPDLLLMSGATQYIEHPNLFEAMRISWLPEHIVLNRVPVHPSLNYVTLQNIGDAYCPYRIYDRPSLERAIADRNYEIVDEWENLEHRCIHPHDPDYSVPSYRGFYLRRRRV